MPIFLIVLALVLSVSAADFLKSQWRTQLYTGITPYYTQEFSVSGAPAIDAKQTLPVHAGFLISPLFTPAYKLDLPLTVWLGAEVGNISGSTLYDKSNLVTNHETVTWFQWMPSVTAGLSLTLWGGFDLKMLGGLGLMQTSFTHEFSSHPKVETHSDFNYFGTVALEYILSSGESSDLKLSLFARQDALDLSNLAAVVPTGDSLQDQLQEISDLRIHRIEQTKLKVGLEVSWEFGRESRADRKTRFKLFDRDSQLRSHNKGGDTLKEWDCMAIERDYKFYLAPDGSLPDMKGKFTLSQFTDVMESFLAFCKPEDLRTKEKLYASLDSNKVAVKTYQISQEEIRFKQVMASNDPAYLSMFLQYYPQSQYRKAVEAKLRILDDYQDFKSARNNNTFKDYLRYLADRPEGHYRKEAETGIFLLVQAANRQKDYEIYLKKFPNGFYINEARKALSEIIRANGGVVPEDLLTN